MFKKGDSAIIFYKDLKLDITIKSVKKDTYIISFKDYRNLKKKFGIGFIPITNEKLITKNLLH